MFNTTEQVFKKYTFPRVTISGSHICCGFRPCYLDGAMHRYTDNADMNSPYESYKAIIFAMCYFSKNRHLHQNAERPFRVSTSERYVDIIEVKTPNGILYGGGSAVNHRHWILTQHHALLISHHHNVCTDIKDYIKENNLGSVYATPNWTSKATASPLGTFLWHWNGNVPTPESAGLTDFPYDVAGNLIPGRTNLRNPHGPVFKDKPQPPSGPAPVTEVQVVAA